MAKSISTLMKYHREWLEKNGTRILERELKFLQEELAEVTAEVFLRMPVPLGGLATYYGILGTVELIDGDENGWQHISTAIDFRGWDLKVRTKTFRKIGRSLNLTTYISRAACLVCVSEKWGGMAESIMRDFDDDPESVDQRYWRSRRFEPFVLACCRMRDRQECATSSIKEPYRAILDNWHDDDALAGALDAVCEYHGRNMDDTGGNWNPEFKYSPFDFLPCEVMLVRRIRKELGLSTPEVSNKFVSLLNAPDAIPAASQEHELLEKVAKAFGEFFT